VLGFIAPPMAAVFLFGVFWKRTTARAANMALTLGTVFSIGVGILYLWVLPAEQYDFWPHFMMLSFYIFIIIAAAMVIVSLTDKTNRQEAAVINLQPSRPSLDVRVGWVLLAAVMVVLYVIFNGH